MVIPCRVGKNSWELEAGGLFTADRIYADLFRPLPTRVASDLGKGIAPILSLDVNHPWSGVNKGEVDSAIAARMAEVAALPYPEIPVYLIIQHEPDNQFNNVWGGAWEYKKMVRRFKAEFQNHVLDHGNVVWCINPTGWNTTLYDSYNPNTLARPDVIGMLLSDPYNWWGTSPSAGWRQPAQLVQPLVQAGLRYRLPIGIAETACREDPTVPNRKAQWLREWRKQAHAYDLKLLSFFEGDPRFGWQLDTSPEVHAVLDQWSHAPLFGGEVV